MAYIIRNAKSEDLPRILEIYAQARIFMEKNGNPNQWGKKKPPQSMLENDIREGNLYVVTEEDRIHGVFAFLLGEDPTYRVIYQGTWRSDAPYGTIHRIAGDGSGGILHSCVKHCSGIIPYLRIDTHEDNFVMRSAVRKEGFVHCGIIYIEDGTARLAFDRM